MKEKGISYCKDYNVGYSATFGFSALFGFGQFRNAFFHRMSTVDFDHNFLHTLCLGKTFGVYGFRCQKNTFLTTPSNTHGRGWVWSEL